MPFHSFGPLELGIIVLIITMIFGVGKLPEVGGALGKGIRKFRHGVSGQKDEEPEGINAEPRQGT